MSLSPADGHTSTRILNRAESLEPATQRLRSVESKSGAPGLGIYAEMYISA